MSKFKLNPDFINPPIEAMWNQFRIWREGQFFLSDKTQLLDSSNRFTKETIKLCADYRQFLADAPQNYASVLDVPFYMWVEYKDYHLHIVQNNYTVLPITKSSEEAFWDEIRIKDPENGLLKQYDERKKKED